MWINGLPEMDKLCDINDVFEKRDEEFHKIASSDYVAGHRIYLSYDLKDKCYYFHRHNKKSDPLTEAEAKHFFHKFEEHFEVIDKTSGFYTPSLLDLAKKLDTGWGFIVWLLVVIFTANSNVMPGFVVLTLVLIWFMLKHILWSGVFKGRTHIDYHLY